MTKSAEDPRSAGPVSAVVPEQKSHGGRPDELTIGSGELSRLPARAVAA